MDELFKFFDWTNTRWGTVVWNLVWGTMLAGLILQGRGNLTTPNDFIAHGAVLVVLFIGYVYPLFLALLGYKSTIEKFK